MKLHVKNRHLSEIFLENRNLWLNCLKNRNSPEICLEKPGFIVKLPEKIEIFRIFALKNRFFCEIYRIVFTRIHDPPDFKSDWRR